MKTKSFFAIKLLNVFFIPKPIKHNLIILFLLKNNNYNNIKNRNNNNNNINKHRNYLLIRKTESQ